MIEVGLFVLQSVCTASVHDAARNARAMVEKCLIGIVDDDIDLPIALSSLLRSLGYRSECFSSAATLLSRGSLQDFCCIISDVHMPAMTGLELSRRLGDIEAGIPIILMTGRMETGLEEKAYASGAKAFLTKPFDFEKLSATLEEALVR
ncbi:response regulator [Neorhizobium alkalisoli]|nr:response regulator [Neorhizobium alkalisoli]